MPFTYHAGEIAVQRRAGVSAVAARMSAHVHDAVPAAALPFLEHLEFVVVGSVDPDRQPWACPVSGDAGFVTAPDDHTLVISTAAAAADPLWPQLGSGSHVGVLGMDFATRRRIRANGTIDRRDGTSIRLRVDEVYSNCRKYIHTRRRTARIPITGPSIRRAGFLGERARAHISGADTFFIVTTDGATAADVSHRGGPAGFVTVLDSRRLSWPDLPGNAMFNTLGNIVLHPPAGVLFLDLEHGRALQLTGTAALRWEDDPAPGETGRTVEFTVRSVVERADALDRGWRLDPLLDERPAG